MSGFAVRLAGEASHGLLFAGYVLAEAALIDRRAVSHAPTSGRAARGPMSGGSLRIGADPDEDPLVDEADCLVLTSAEALRRFAGSLAPGGLLIAEETLEELPEHAIALPLAGTAAEAGGTKLLVDMVAAAAVVEITGEVTRRALAEAAARLLPERSRAAGLAALEAGRMLGRRRPRG